MAETNHKPTPAADVMKYFSASKRPQPPLEFRWAGSILLCVIAGFVLAIAGVYLIMESNHMSYGMQKLILGGTLTISGAVFLAAGIRPR